MERHALDGLVVTADALLAERALAAQIRAHEGRYILLITGSQQGITDLIQAAPWTIAERAQ